MPNGAWWVVVPESGQNVIANPSVEETFTPWAGASGAVLLRTTVHQKWGAHSIKVSPSSNNTDGALYDSASLAASGNWYASVFVLGSSAVPYRFFLRNSSSAIAASTNFTGTDGWQRISASASIGASGVFDIFIVKNSSSSTCPFYVDGLQVENTSYLTTYMDGDQEGCIWLGTKHASKTLRDAQHRAGGKLVNLENDYGFVIKDQPGTGMAAVENNSLQYGLLDGSVYQRTRTRERQFTLTGYVRSASSSGSNLTAGIHTSRKPVLNAFKPDRVATAQPVRLVYTGAGSTLEIDAVYDSGLEFGTPKAANDQFGVRFTAFDPYWKGEGNSGASLPVNIIIGTANRILQRSASGTWFSPSSGMNNTVHVIAKGNDQNWYVGGDFTTAGGTTACRIARWDGSTWSAIGNGMNDTVLGLAFAPNDDLYAVGEFTTASNTTACRIAKWSSSAWSAVASGANNDIDAIAISSTGLVYAGGEFSTIGGVSACGLAVWNGASWSEVGDGLSTGGVFAMTFGLDSNLYAGGLFTMPAGTASNIARWDGSSWAALGSPPNLSGVLGLGTGLDGMIYATGFFSSIGGIGASNAAKWNGAAWQPLGRGLGSIGEGIAVANDGRVIFSGTFDTADGRSLPDRVAQWNETTWTPLDFDVTGSPTFFASHIDNEGVITVGWNSSTTNASAAAVTQLTNNGMSNAYPMLKLKASTSASSRVFQFINSTSNDRIYFDLSLNAGETATLDLSPGKKTFTSTFRGNIINKILPGSNVATWRLLPGLNNVSVFITGGAASAWITWKERHWSADGGAG